MAARLRRSSAALPEELYRDRGLSLDTIEGEIDHALAHLASTGWVLPRGVRPA